jgi:hypothetical protein
MDLLQVAMETIASLKDHIQLRGSALSLSSSNKTGKATPILSMGDYADNVDRVEALTACHVFPVAGRPVAGDSVDRVKGA